MSGEASPRGRTVAAAFAVDGSGASAVEFAIVASPFIMLLLGVLQVGIFYMTQSALDAGLIRTADNLRNTFTTGTNPTMPTASTLKASVSTNSGGTVRNTSSLAVEIRPLAALDAAVLPVTDGTVDYGTATSTLVLRAQTSVVTFAPGFGSLAQARSSAMIRRQGH